jgi:hypothetical protein
MRFWIYKCNAKGQEYQPAVGDWAAVFETTDAQWWGMTKDVPELANASVGDTVIAYQTDRIELVGVARVVRWQPAGKYKKLWIKPIRPIGTRVRPLKNIHPAVTRIPALQPGPIHTLYPISHRDAAVLLKAADMQLKAARVEGTAERNAEKAMKGAGFGSPEENKQVERAALRHVTRYYRSQGWSVEDVSLKNNGYDLLCKWARTERHVEVKGARGHGQQFIVTANELNAWTKDRRFVLAFVGSALSRNRSLLFFSRAESQKEFSIRPLSFVAARQPKRAATRATQKRRRR